MIRCSREFCGGIIICDTERSYCHLCNRSPDALPAPLPLTPRRKPIILPLAVLDDIERARRKARAAYQRERRYRESHAISKMAR